MAGKHTGGGRSSVKIAHEYGVSEKTIRMTLNLIKGWINYRRKKEVLMETVIGAKEFLDGELRKYETFADLEKAPEEFFRRLVDKFNFEKTKKEGIGRETLLKFLGKNWTEWYVWAAFEILAPGEGP